MRKGEGAHRVRGGQRSLFIATIQHERTSLHKDYKEERNSPLKNDITQDTSRMQSIDHFPPDDPPGFQILMDTHPHPWPAVMAAHQETNYTPRGLDLTRGHTTLFDRR
ncbi:hypothetical protein RRG08_013521 [Elysia crispata]|uniref:Uncharacterized protein n=1 Tax=Elysia crispata TaxID=231223 RepID=A0AAE1CQQ7_9GAST|nr:hypothetical protein RRG08_013521 [Elysia crispata]